MRSLLSIASTLILLIVMFRNIVGADVSFAVLICDSYL